MLYRRSSQKNSFINYSVLEHNEQLPAHASVVNRNYLYDRAGSFTENLIVYNDINKKRRNRRKPRGSKKVPGRQQPVANPDSGQAGVGYANASSLAQVMQEEEA